MISRGTTSVRRALYYLTGVAPQQPWWTLALFLIGVLGVEILAGYISDVLGFQTAACVPLRVLVPVGSFILVVLGYAAGSRFAEARYGLTLTLQAPQRHEGLILLLSPFRPPDSASPEAVQKALVSVGSSDPDQRAAALEALDLRRSNLWPQLAAISYHLEEGALRDCWLITTGEYMPAGEQTGSLATVPILEAYLRNLSGGHNVALHTGESYTVELTGYDAIYSIVDRIFRTESPYRPARVIADITGGTKLMTLGIALACLSRGRKMQYMSGDRDWKGDAVPRGELTPVLVDVDAVLRPRGVGFGDRGDQNGRDDDVGAT